MKNIVASLQPIGRALMLPIAVLPAAALLLRLGQPDLLNIAAMAAAGNAIFSNLGLLFAIGVAVGLARENHGAAGLAAVVGYLVTTKGAEVLIGVPPQATADLTGRAIALATDAYRAKELAKLSVPAGLINGLLAGWLYNRYSNVRLPAYLAFFAGRRFVPIVSGLAGIVLAFCFGYGFPIVESGMDAASQAVLASGGFALFLYGVLNRVLIVTGLHHIINNFVWFLLGDYNGVTGDLNRFVAGDPTAGKFMSGFFPVMMFGLPAACLAMYRSAPVEKRALVGGMLFSMALTSFLTGVTEPIEFSFMFLAPVLYAIHAVLTGAAMALMDAIGVHLGFGFSAGLFDYVLSFSKATRPLLLLPIGLVYFALYYGLFRFFIVRFDLKTPGRELEEATAGAQPRVSRRLHDPAAPRHCQPIACRRSHVEEARCARRSAALCRVIAGRGRTDRRPAGIRHSQRAESTDVRICTIAFREHAARSAGRARQRARRQAGCQPTLHRSEERRRGRRLAPGRAARARHRQARRRQSALCTRSVRGCGIPGIERDFVTDL
jgi:PTS system N-acetylglucosamine-specific IIC component